MDEYDEQLLAEGVPVSACLKVVRQSEQEQLDEEEIDWNEIRRLVFERDWKAILDLPEVKNQYWSPRAQWDESGADCSAFNTHDYQSQRPNRRRFAIDRAKQEAKEALWVFEMVWDRIKSPAKYQVMKYLERGIIEVDHCEGEMQRAAYWWRRRSKALEEAKRIRQRA